eukprot:CAMPEP_0175050930 /NCGR_PEP_ID=MMETSP0052_2-20121109/7518_1 /TAXON_ID=51329 ORGANISM="Polytomella parva, Strain SAG 63-3" /NCGR_SAMPLE_ID=MMETSP0052_2 /ASSEMBLY_ACC=CAM_ASM_000194 /LENGTH=628 /DNA_ID=CAMNT_0016315159 /DNA_START=128 /DNA_END=2014 /DNA_ORIENTATION=-
MSFTIGHRCSPLKVAAKRSMVITHSFGKESHPLYIPSARKTTTLHSLSVHSPSPLINTSTRSVHHRSNSDASRTPTDALGSHQVLHVVPDGRDSQPISPGAGNLLSVLLAVGVSCAGAFAFGYHLGIVNGPLEQISRDIGIAGDKNLQGMIVSSTLLGAALGSLGGGGLSDGLGRRTSFLLASVPMLAGPLLSSVATDLNVMVMGRFLAGFAIGLSSALVPTYISEIAPTRYRGTLGALNQLSICLGILAALLINVIIPSADWRVMFTLAAAPAVILGGGMLLAPESPRWLISRGRYEQADKAARRLWGLAGAAELVGSSRAIEMVSKGDGGSSTSINSSKSNNSSSSFSSSGKGLASDGFIGKEILDRDGSFNMEHGAGGDNSTSAPLSSSVSSSSTAFHRTEGGLLPPSTAQMASDAATKPLIMGCLLFLFQQFAGINALVYFSSSVFQEAGVANGALASAAVGATNVIGTLLAMSLIERLGRKQLLSNSFLGQAACMFAMAAGFSIPALQPYAGSIAIAGTLAYIFSFALGAGPIPGLIVAEINPLRTRGRAVAAAFVSHWICNVAVGQTFMSAVQTYGIGTVYSIFGAFALAAAAYVKMRVPETKGKTLEQIEAEFNQGSMKKC